MAKFFILYFFYLEEMIKIKNILKIMCIYF